MDLSRDWPAEGRVAKVTEGPYAGAWALFTREADNLWFVYLAWPGPPARYDDFHTTDSLIPTVASSMGLQWLGVQEDHDVERAVFGLRDEWRRQRTT